jgi:tetratricopeptide (TPR) repeat protein
VEGRSSGEETFWAVRKLLEAEARKRPFVLVFDDIQWGEPTFLDLIEHVADLARDAPILLVCLARPELLDTRPSWGGGKFNATSVLLEPLGDDDSAELIDNLLGRAELASDVRARVAEAAEGNPLFVEEMLGMLIDDGLLERRNGNWVATGGLSSISVPPSIQALLSARLDRLEPDERAVVERGSVEGKVFHRGAVAELAPADLRNDVSGHLQTLVRKELLRPDSAQFAGEDAFRFRHLLIRDAAYNAIPKELRAELHERFAAWLDRAAGARVREYEEILGFHLEQAYKYRDELAPLDEEARALGIRAGTHLGAAGERALARSDAPAAISLLDRAAAVLPASSAMRLKVLCDLGLSLTDRGDLARAEAVLLEATTTAEGSDDTVLTAVANLRLTWVRLLGGPAEMAQSQEEVEDLVRTLEDLGDERAVAEAYSLLGTILMWTGSCSEAVEDFERSISLARRVGADKVAARSVGSLVICSLWGPMPVREGMILCDRIVAETTDRYLVGFAGLVKSFLQMMAGEWAEGRALLEASRQQLEELGQDVNVASTRMASARSEFFAGRLREAEIELRVAYEALEPMGERGYLSSISALLAVVLCAQGRYDDASSYVQRAQELGAKDDFTTEVYWRFAQAEIHASKGEFEIAFRLLDAADAWIDGTDYLADIAFARTSRATVEQAAGNPDRARSALEEAIALLEKKGDVSAADHARERMAQL